jgi:putative photosynthetic complex assembly protein 2
LILIESASLSLVAVPVLFTLFIWWFSTGVILFLDGLPRKTFRWSLTGATVVAGGALIGLSISSQQTGASSAYCAFTCSLLIWGWQEMAFLMGAVTGPRKLPCPKDCSESQRFVFATQAILHHELALLATTAAVVAVTWNAANQIGTWTFVILFSMRLSAKLNMFLGVRNLYESFLPEHLQHLKSYFSRRAMNLLFPVSVSAATAVASLLWCDVFSAGASAYQVVGFTLLATLLTLAVIEHWFLVLPLPVEAMWKWAMGSRAGTGQPADTDRAAKVAIPLR